MTSRRVTLPGGDWLDLASELNHAQLRRVKRSLAGDGIEVEQEAVAALATAWLVHDLDGREIPFPGCAADGIAVETLDRFPARHVVAAFVAASEIIAGEPDPKDTAGSFDSLPAAPG